MVNKNWSLLTIPSYLENIFKFVVKNWINILIKVIQKLIYTFSSYFSIK